MSLKLRFIATITKSNTLPLPMPGHFWQGIIKDLERAMKQATELLNTNEIIVIGSLNPDKQVQDRVRVLSKLGMCQALRATDYKDPPKIIDLWEMK